MFPSVSMQLARKPIPGTAIFSVMTFPHTPSNTRGSIQVRGINEVVLHFGDGIELPSQTPGIEFLCSLDIFSRYIKMDNR